MVEVILDDYVDVFLMILKVKIYFAEHLILFKYSKPGSLVMLILV